MLNKYRIYSRISREILDKFWTIFSQFDLYAGHQKLTILLDDVAEGWEWGDERTKDGGDDFKLAGGKVVNEKLIFIKSY